MAKVKKPLFALLGVQSSGIFQDVTHTYAV